MIFTERGHFASRLSITCPEFSLVFQVPWELNEKERWYTHGTASIFSSFVAGAKEESSRTSWVVGTGGMAASHDLCFIRQLIDGVHIFT